MTDNASDSDDGSSGGTDEDIAREADEAIPGEKETFGKVNRVLDVWEDVIEDMEETAEEYRDAGWEVLTIHPGDVAAPDGEKSDRWGLDVLVPGDEFDELQHLMEEEAFAFDESEVYRGTGSGLVLLVVAILDHNTEVAILFPTYYDIEQGRPMIEQAMEAGEMRTHLRPLEVDNIITFTHDDPALFAPPSAAGNAEDA